LTPTATLPLLSDIFNNRPFGQSGKAVHPVSSNAAEAMFKADEATRAQPGRRRRTGPAVIDEAERLRKTS
jgi:hypothetical protein